jgi:hypothetical protein
VSDVVWIVVSAVAIMLLVGLLVVAGVALPLVFAGWLFAMSAVVAVGQIGKN